MNYFDLGVVEILNLRIFDEKHVWNDRVYNFDPAEFEIFHQNICFSVEIELVSPQGGIYC